MRHLPSAVSLSCLSLLAMGGCVAGSDIESHYSPKRMCSGDTVTLTARLDTEMSTIKIWDATGDRLLNKKDTKKIELEVPNLRKNQLQFKVYAKKERRLAKDWDTTRYSNFELFDDPHWSDPFGPNLFSAHTDIESTTQEATESETFCSAFQTQCAQFETQCRARDSAGNCTREERVCVREDTTCIREETANTRTCFTEHKVYYVYDGATWALRLGEDYSARIKVRKIKNLTGRNVTIQWAGNSIVAPAGGIVDVPLLSPGDVTVSLAIEPSIRTLCETVTKTRTCPGDTGISDGELSKEDYPDAWECYPSSPPVIEMELICDVP